MTRSFAQIAAVAAAVAAASASVVLRQEEGCRSAGVRCAGAPGQPFVPYDQCCEGLSCMGAGTEYGLFCVDVENPGEYNVTDIPVPASGGEVPAEDMPAEDMPAEEMPAEEMTMTTAVPTAADDATTVAAAAEAAGEEEDDEDAAAGATVVGTGASAGTTGATEAPTAAETATMASAADDGDDAADATGEEDDAVVADAVADATGEEDDTVVADADATDEDDDDLAGRVGVTPSPDDDDDGSVCFPAAATVELENGDVVAMDSLSVGDVVKVGVDKFSRVFMFTHKMAAVDHEFVTLKTESGAALTLTRGHYLYVNGALVAAKTVRVGDVLTLGSGEASRVEAVGATSGTGLFNPQTVSGDVVVNGVLASTYTTAVEPSFAHAVLAPFRVLNRFGFQFTALESGGGIFAGAAPRGQACL